MYCSSAGDWGAARRNVVLALEAFDAIAQRTGKELVLALEAEPGCMLETTDEVIEFFAQLKLPVHLARHAGVCFDCCHHAVEFASRGYGVVGYDLSLYQLALAADVAQERSQKLNFLQGDMREMAFEETFDGVFCWNTTFGYFEEDKNLAVAQRVFKALRPGGMFLVDVINRDFAAASAPCTVWYEGDACVCMDDMSVDYISSRLRVKRSIILDDGRTKESVFSLRLYSLHELGKLLHEVGFRVTEASGHPTTPGVFFGPNSPRIIMLAQRP